eukprot:385615_1
MSSNRVPRAAALKAKQRVKVQSDGKNELRMIHRGEIRLSEYAYVNPDANPLIGDTDKGAVLIASPPMLDKNNDYGVDCIFANDASKSHFVRAMHVVQDKGYKKHLKDLKKKENVPKVIQTAVKKVLKQAKKAKKKKEETKEDTTSVVGASQAEHIQENVSQQNISQQQQQQQARPQQQQQARPPQQQQQQARPPQQQQNNDLQAECQQKLYWIGYTHIYPSVSVRSLINKKKCHYEGFMSNRMWNRILKPKMDKISARFILEKNNQENMNFYYDKIHNKKFYSLFGEEYCMREIENKDYYMDAIKVDYNYNKMRMNVCWIIANKGKKKDSRCRIQAAANY